MKDSSSIHEAQNGTSKYPLIILGLLYFLSLAAVIAYLWMFTQDRYISTASFKISRQNATAGDFGLAQLALPGLSDNGSADSQIAIGFVDSTDLLLDLEKEFKLREHYSKPMRDFVFRLETDAPLEKRIEYYRKRISAHFDKETGMTILSVDTFEPALSQKIAKSVLDRAEQYINTMNQSIADQQLVFIRSELERSEKNVNDVSQELLTLQNTNNLISPDEAISENLSTVQKLRMEQLQIETSLTSLERDSPESPRIETLRSHLRSINERLAIESNKISGPEQDRLNQVLARYKEVRLKLDFALKLRMGAETLLEKYRVDSSARSRFFSVIQTPFLPEDVGYPQRPYASITILGLGILLFLILRILVQSVFERSV